MAFGGDVDTLSLTFDKLQYIFNGYGQIRDSFIETNTAYRQGKISETEFFYKIQEGVMRFSALEFLAIKAVFEIKKSIDKSVGMVDARGDNSGLSIPESSPSGHSIASFIVAGTLSRPHSDMPYAKQGIENCPRCRTPVKKNANFCINCGQRL